MYSSSIRTGATIGLILGMALAAVLWFTVPAYHDLVMWQLHHPVLLIAGFGAGVLIAVLTDSD